MLISSLIYNTIFYQILKKKQANFNQFLPHFLIEKYDFIKKITSANKGVMKKGRYPLSAFKIELLSSLLWAFFNYIIPG